MKLYPTVLIPDLEDGLFTPVENVYLLTVDEIKKIVSDAFDAGFKVKQQGILIKNIELKTQKEQYINNLKLD
jgi:hypothetical protein